MGDIIVFSRADKTPDELLQEAIGKLQRVIVIGITTEGLEYSGNSGSYLPDTLWDLERYRYTLMKQFDEE